jgi:preprotein translocase subunit YajC
MKPIFIVAILVMATLPLYAQAQQPDKAKLKADSQKVVSIIKGDKVKTQAYCQIADLTVSRWTRLLRRETRRNLKSWPKG